MDNLLERLALYYHVSKKDLLNSRTKVVQEAKNVLIYSPISQRKETRFYRWLRMGYC
jgi:hypothetical protein